MVGYLYGTFAVVFDEVVDSTVVKDVFDLSDVDIDLNIIIVMVLDYCYDIYIYILILLPLNTIITPF